MIDSLILVSAQKEQLEEIDMLIIKELKANNLLGQVDVMHYVYDFLDRDAPNAAYIEVFRQGNEVFQQDPINLPNYMSPEKKEEYIRAVVAALC